MKCKGETIQIDLENAGVDLDNVTEQDLQALGFRPIRAWALPDQDLVVFELKAKDGPGSGELWDVGF